MVLHLNMGALKSRNLTLKLDATLYRAVKIVAAQRDTSISALVTEKLEELVGEESAYNDAKARAKSYLERGFDLGTHGEIDWARDELHER